MLDLNDPQWATFNGGYRVRYDASVPLRLLQMEHVNRDQIWEELTENLYHQNDIGIASYAAVPHLVRIYKQHCWLDWKIFALVSWIEEARHLTGNPPLPAWLEADYNAAIYDLFLFGKNNVNQDVHVEIRRAFLCLSAFALNLPSLGRLLIRLSSDLQVDEFLENI